jgi:hypothetical protein
VIGSWASGYVGFAQSIGAAFFSLTIDAYAAAGTLANQAFISAAISVGMSFIVTTPSADAGPGLQMEINMLLAAGYTWLDSALGTTLQPPGGY